MKYGSWTYDGNKIDLRHLDEEPGKSDVELGIDLSDFHLSVEWDIIEVPARRNRKIYLCCEATYLDITFNISMRRKTLFYTVNLILPVGFISFLTVLVFYLPSDSCEKISLSVSILVALTVFFLLLAETIPPTSLTIPFLGKYLLFTMLLVGLSICVTVITLNVHFRSASTHKMSRWMKIVFLQILPKLLCMRRPNYQFANGASLDHSTNHVSDHSDYPIYSVNSINHHLNKSNLNESKCSKKKIKRSFLNGFKQTNKVYSVERETIKAAANRADAQANKKSKIQRQNTQLSNDKINRPTIDNLRSKDELNKSPLEIDKNLLNPVMPNEINYSLHSLRSLHSLHSIDESIDKNLSNKLYSIRNSTNSVKSLEQDSSKEDNDLNNNSYLNNNQLGNQLDYRLDLESDIELDQELYEDHEMNSKLDQIDNQLNREKFEDLYRQIDFQNELNFHGDQLNKTLNCSNRSIKRSIESVDEDECSFSNQQTNNCSEPINKCTINTCSNKFIKQPNYSTQQVKRQYSDSLITKKDRSYLKTGHFNKSIDQILLNQTTHQNRLQSKQCSVHKDRSPIFNETSHQAHSSRSVNQHDRSSIKQEQRNLDETIFLQTLYQIERNPHIIRAMRNFYFLSEHTKKTIQEEEIKEEWKYMAMVLDRMFLWIFLIAVMFGSFSIILLDKRHPGDTAITLSLLNKTNSMQNMWSDD